MYKIQKKYLLAAVVLLLIEILIALYMHDRIIRPYVGDFLVVILLYCTVKSFVNISVRAAALGVLLFSYLIEVSQYLHLVEVLGLGHYETANVVMGTSFAWIDLLAYTLGVLTILWFENRK